MDTVTSACAPRHICVCQTLCRPSASKTVFITASYLWSVVYLLSAVVWAGDSTCSALSVTTSLCWMSMAVTCVTLHRNCDWLSGSCKRECWLWQWPNLDGWQTCRHGSVGVLSFRYMDAINIRLYDYIRTECRMEGWMDRCMHRWKWQGCSLLTGTGDARSLSFWSPHPSAGWSRCKWGQGWNDKWVESRKTVLQPTDVPLHFINKRFSFQTRLLHKLWN